MSAPKGHPKWGGKPRGHRTAATIDKILHREELRRLVVAHLEPMTLAQIAHAQGVSYMVLRCPDGTFTRATDEKQIDAACASGAQAFRIFTQAPNVQAYTDLMNRALDKPIEQLEVTGAEGGPLEIIVKVPWRDRKKA